MVVLSGRRVESTVNYHCISPDFGPLRVKSGPPAGPLGRSAPGGEADEIRAKAEVAARRSALGGRADVPATWSESPLVAISRLTVHGNSNRDMAHCAAGGARHLQHQASIRAGCRLACSTSADTRGRPSFLPSPLARSSPALMRSRMIARSNSAKTPIIWNRALPGTRPRHSQKTASRRSSRNHPFVRPRSRAVKRS